MSYKYFFIIHFIIYCLLILGILPREIFLFWSVALIPILIYLGSRQSLLFFISIVTTSVALPISYSFDSLSMWRPLIIFIGAIFIYENLNYIKSLTKKIKSRNYIFKLSNLLKFTLIFIILLLLSLIDASDKLGGIKRLIFFTNMAIPAVLIYLQIRLNRDFIRELADAILLSLIAPISFGIIQLSSTYLLNIYDFIIIWGEKIQHSLYGRVWSETAIKANTWFAYFGDQLSLRMFSIFPDSHSFPIFLIFTLPAIFYRGVKKLQPKSILKKLDPIFFIVLAITLLLAILSGTRGIWASGGLMLALAISTNLISRWLNKLDLRVFSKYTFFIISLFIGLFAIAYPIFASSQFMSDKADSDQILIRIRSILDLEETSNNARLYIWKKTIYSIAQSPLLGVGLYNFPVILAQDTSLTKAGSSAHNIYLHIAGELGVPALIIVLATCSIFIYRSYSISHSKIANEKDKILAVIFTISFIWIGIYSMTDFALFDERAFILFITNLAIINALYYYESTV